MRTRVFRLVVGILALLIASGCILSRHVDRAFTGMHSGPVYKNRIYTGLFLLPLAFVVDLATLPIQFIMLVAAGDDFLAAEDDKQDLRGGATKEVQLRLERDPTYAKLKPEQQTKLREFLLARARAGGPMPRAYGMTPDGEWVEVPVSEETRQEMLLRATAAKNR
jgi:hypothetical protein